jgi:hypothetical protein
MNNFFRLVIILPVLFVLNGCESAVNFSGFSAGYDKAMEKSANQNLFLNIIRSGYKKPSHFNTVSGVSGTSTLASPAGFLSLPFDQIFSLSRNGAAGSFSTPSFSQTSTVSISPLNTAEFLGGLLTQIAPSTIEFYSSQGVPKELLFLLIVDRISVVRQGKTVNFINNPTHSSYKKFDELLQGLLEMGLTTETVVGLSASGPVLSKQQAKDPARISLVVNSGMILNPVQGSNGEEYQMFVPFKYSRFCFSKSSKDLLDLPKPMHCGNNSSTQNSQTLNLGNGNHRLEKYKGVSLSIITRSTKGMFDYLGQLAYQQVERDIETPVRLVTDEAKKYNYQNTGDAIFVVTKNNTKSSDVVSVNMNGDSFSIPHENQGFSSHVLSLAMDVLNLSKTLNSLPPANTIITN